MPSSCNPHCAAAGDIDEYDACQENGRCRPQHATLSTHLPSVTSSSFNPDAAPFVFNPRLPTLNPLAEPFNPHNSSSASSAPRPPIDVPLSPHCPPFDPLIALPLPESLCPPFSLEQSTCAPNRWDAPGSSDEQLDSGATRSRLVTLRRLPQSTEEQAEAHASTQDVAHQDVTEAPSEDVLESVAPRTSPETRSLTLAQSALSDHNQQHEHLVTSIRATVHAEVVRALQRLTALPMSGELVHASTKSRSAASTAAASSSNANHTLAFKPLHAGCGPGNAGDALHAPGDFDRLCLDTDASSPRKNDFTKRLAPHSARYNGSAVKDRCAQGAAAVASSGEPGSGKECCTPAVLFMDKISARAHADAITSHTHRAFQRLDGSTALADSVTVNFCKAIMVDVLATAASWRMWVCDQSLQTRGAREMLEAEHCMSLDAVQSAVPSTQTTFKQLDMLEEDSDLNEELPDQFSSTAAQGRPRAAASLQHMASIDAEPVAAVPWAASAGNQGYFLKQARRAVVRLLHCVSEAGPNLLLMTDTPADCASSAGYSATATLDDRDEVPGFSAIQQPDEHTLQGDMSQWSDARASEDFPVRLQQEAAEREYDTADTFGVVSGTGVLPPGGSDQLHGEDSDDDAWRDRGTMWQPSRVRVPSRQIDEDADEGSSRLRVVSRQPRPCLSPHAIPPAGVAFASLVSPQATPCGRQPWSRLKDDLSSRRPRILGVLEPQHPLLKPIIIREPGVAIGCALPNEANQHLTLTQQDGSEPLWRAGVYSSEVAQRGLHVDTVLDSRVAYVHCIIGPPSCVTAMNLGMEPVKATARSLQTSGMPTVDSQKQAPVETPSSPPAAAQAAQFTADELTCDGDKSTAPMSGSILETEASVMISAWALSGVLINGSCIQHNEFDELSHGDKLALVPHSAVGPELNYIFKVGDPTAALISPSPSAAALLPPLHSVPLCQICGDLPHECLELQPCGHTFCTACLSHFFAAVLTSGSHLTCPHGCPRPDNIDRCMEVDMLVASLPEYLPRLARVIDWRRRDVSTGDAATPRASGSLPRSPNWGGALRMSEDSPMYTSLHAVDAHGSDRDPDSAVSPFERFVESLGPDVWPNTPQPTSRTPTHTRVPLTGTDRSASLLQDFRAHEHDSVGPAGMEPATPLSTAGATMRPVSISELVPLSKDMTPLPMQELYAQQADVSARVIKVAANSNCEIADLQQLVRHFYAIAHATTAGPLWKDELNRSGTVEDAAAVVHAVVTASKQGDKGPDGLGGVAGQQVLCAVASMICALVLAQLPGSEEVCQGNQWRAARAHVVEALIGALEAWPGCHLTCHATLQCLVALCKDNAMMKANMTVIALKPVLQALHICGSCSAIAERGFTLLAVLQAGGDHLNDGIRRLLIEHGLQRASIRALQTHSGGDERALTAVCFAVAMILRGGEKWRESIKWRAARSALPKTICMADKAYRQQCESVGIPQDEALAALLAFLVLYLEPVQKRMRSWRQLGRRALEWTCAASLSSVVVAAGCRMIVGSRQL